MQNLRKQTSSRTWVLVTSINADSNEQVLSITWQLQSIVTHTVTAYNSWTLNLWTKFTRTARKAQKPKITKQIWANVTNDQKLT